MAACGMVILAGFLLGGCGSVESGIVRTTAAVEGYQNPDAKESCAAENVWKEGRRACRQAGQYLQLQM